jgi:hypothetical protein
MRRLQQQQLDRFVGRCIVEHYNDGLGHPVSVAADEELDRGLNGSR